MSIFSYIFTLLFLILGGLLWCLLLLIVCIGAVGIIRIMLMSVFDFDFVKWWKCRKLKSGIKSVNEVREELGFPPIDEIKITKRKKYEIKNNE